MQLPGPVRAAIGLAANAVDEARHLPDRAIELPMLAVSTALQLSLRAQQRYAGLTARGDEVLGGARTTDDPPPWARFDDPVPSEELRALARDQLGDSADASALIEELFGPEHSGTETADDDAVPGGAGDADAAPDAGSVPDVTPPTPITAARGSSRRTTARKSAAKKSTTTQAAAADAAVEKHAPKKQPPAKGSSATKRATSKDGANPAAPATKPAAKKAAGKRISKPRHTAPSKFDDAGDD